MMQEPRPFIRNPFRVETNDRKKEIYVSTDVHAYLEATNRPGLCESLFKCDKWKVEPTLLKDLETMEPGPERDKVRGLIRAVSNFPPDRRTTEDILRGVDTETRSQDTDWHKIEDAVQGPLVGADLEEAVEHIEHRYNLLMRRWEHAEEGQIKDTLADEIERLRPVRDELYLRRVHPDFARAMMTKIISINRYNPTKNEQQTKPAA